MKGTINLNKPITINGQLVTELTYDTEEITAALFCEADTRRRIDAGVKNVAIIPSAEFDFGLHPYLGMAAGRYYATRAGNCGTQWPVI